jgi:hypothetical protein
MGATARARTEELFGTPLLSDAQFAALVGENHTPLLVPAYKSPPDTARAKTVDAESENPLLYLVQFPPLFVERYTPLLVPAKRYHPPDPLGLVTKQLTVMFARVELG